MNVLMEFVLARAILQTRMSPEYSRFRVTGVAYDKATGQSRLLLTDDAATVRLSFQVEPHQAGDVILQANGCAAEKRDVLQLFLRAHGFRIMYARITAAPDGDPQAEIHYHQSADLYRLPLTPSQAVALSASTAAPVYVDRRLVPSWPEREAGPSGAHEEILPIPAH